MMHPGNISPIFADALMGRVRVELDLQLVASFLMLIEEENFGRAAARLHITAPTMTKRIQRLEQQLGVNLLERSARGVLGVTGAGRRFAEGAGPLLDQAASVVRATHDEANRRSVRIGVPAGTAEFLEIIAMRKIARQIRQQHPAAEFSVVNVPFPALRSCLPDEKVDVLLTIGSVRSAGVESIPIPVHANRIGVVHQRHPLAGEYGVTVGDLASEPTLYNPNVPDEFMRGFWLGDIRQRGDAHLIPIAATHTDATVQSVVDNVVMISLDRIRTRLGPQFLPVPLTGIDPVHFCAARRRDDRTSLTLSVCAALQVMAPITF